MSSSSNSTYLPEGVLGFPTALATAIGLIIAGSVLLTVTTGFGIGGSQFAIAMVIAYLIILCQLTTFSEAACMIPTAGSIYDYISCGLGRFLAVTGTLSAYLLVHVFAGTAEVATLGVFASFNFDTLSGLQESGSWMIAIPVLIFFGIANILGVDCYAKSEIAMTLFMWVALVFFGLAGILMAPTVELNGYFGESVIGTDLTSILSLVGLALFLFVGCEFVTPLAVELKNPNKNIPRSMFLGVTMVFVAMFVYGAGMVRHVENLPIFDNGPNILTTPMAIPLYAESLFGPVGKWLLGVALFFASAATINTLLAGIPRILYGMAKDHALPSVFGYLHPRFKTPVVGIVVATLIPAFYAIVIDGDIDSILSLILAGVCAWLLSYILVNMAIIALRVRRPDLVRPYRIPLYPVPQIISIAGMLLAFWFIAPPGITRSDIYQPFGIALALMAVYAIIWIALVNKRSLFSPVEPELIFEESHVRPPV